MASDAAETRSLHQRASFRHAFLNTAQ